MVKESNWLWTTWVQSCLNGKGLSLVVDYMGTVLFPFSLFFRPHKQYSLFHIPLLHLALAWGKVVVHDQTLILFAELALLSVLASYLAV